MLMLGWRAKSKRGEDWNGEVYGEQDSLYLVFTGLKDLFKAQKFDMEFYLVDRDGSASWVTWYGAIDETQKRS